MTSPSAEPLARASLPSPRRPAPGREKKKRRRTKRNERNERRRKRTGTKRNERNERRRARTRTNTRARPIPSPHPTSTATSTGRTSTRRAFLPNSSRRSFGIFRGGATRRFATRTRTPPRTRTLTRRRRVRRPATCTVARRTPFARRSSPPVCATRPRARFDATETSDARGFRSPASDAPIPTNPTTFFRDRSVRFTRSFAFGDGTTSSFATPCSPPAAARFPSPGSTKTNPWRFASTWTETETGTAMEIERRWHVVSVGVSQVSTGFLSGLGARGDVRARSTRRLSDPSNTPTRRTPSTRNYPRRIRPRRYGSAAGENEGARRSRDGAARDACRTRLSDAGPYTRDRARRAVRSPTRTGNREFREPPFDAPNREPGTEPSPFWRIFRSFSPPPDRKRVATPDVRSIPRSSRSRPRHPRRVRVSGAVSAGGGGIAAEVPGVRGQVQGESGARGGTIGDGRVRGVRRGGAGKHGRRTRLGRSIRGGGRTRVVRRRRRTTTKKMRDATGQK